MDDPLLGTLVYDDVLEGYASAPRPLRFLGGHACRFIVFEGDPRPEEVRAAIANALDAGPEVLIAAEQYVLQYREEMCALQRDREERAAKLKKPSDVWSHVQFGDEIVVRRRAKGNAEDGVYLSLECNCDWEVEHGLQLVLRDGRVISKVGPFDGHLTNAAAFGDPSLIGVVYKSFGARARGR